VGTAKGAVPAVRQLIGRNARRPGVPLPAGPPGVGYLPLSDHTRREDPPPRARRMNYQFAALGVLAYLGAGVFLLVRSWGSSRRRPFRRHNSPWEPVAVLLWPALPRMWWPRR
jgi:hypothetical protein